MNVRRRRPARLTVVVATGLLALVGLSACGSSAPSNRRIATDVIDGLTEQLPEEQRQCMLDYVNGLESSVINGLVDQLDEARVDASGNLVDPPADVVAFQNELAACRDGAATPDGTAVETTAATSTPESSGVESTDVTSAPETTTPNTSSPDISTPVTTDA